MIDPNGPAFAVRIDKEMHVRCQCGANMNGHDSLIPSGGLPIRLHIAAMAMQGIVSGEHSAEGGGLFRDSDDPPWKGSTDTCRVWRQRELTRSAKDALAYADALIAEYNRQQEKPHA